MRGCFFFSLCAIIPWKYHGNILWTSLNSKYPLFLVDQHQFDVRLGALPHSGAGSPGGIWIPIDVMWVTFPDILYLDSVYDFCLSLLIIFNIKDQECLRYMALCVTFSPLLKHVR